MTSCSSARVTVAGIELASNTANLTNITSIGTCISKISSTACSYAMNLIDFLEIGCYSTIYCDILACLAIDKTWTGAGKTSISTQGAEIVVSSKGRIIEVA